MQEEEKKLDEKNETEGMQDNEKVENENTESNQQAENNKNEGTANNTKTKKKSKKILVILLLIVIAVCAILFGLKYTSDKQNVAGVNNNNYDENGQIGYISSLEQEDIVELKDKSSKIVSTELLITFKDNISKEDAKKVIEKYEGEIVGELYFLNQYQVRFKESGEELLNTKKEKFKSETSVENVIYNYVNESETDYDKVGSSVNAEIHFDKDYQISELGIDTAYAAVSGSESINVGIIDAPIYYTHEDLNIDKNNIFFLASKDFETIDDVLSYYATYDHEEDKENKNAVHNFGEGCSYLGFRSHGTHVAGIIAASHNGKGIDGVNDNANLYYASGWYYSKDDNYDGRIVHRGTTFSYAYALSSLIMSDCKVINMSISCNCKDENNKLTSISDNNKIYLEYLEYYNDFFSKIKDTNKDFLIVKSAGNNSTNKEVDILMKVFRENDFANEHLIVVGAAKRPGTVATSGTILNFSYKKSSYTNYGEYVDIFAPGTIYSTIYDNDYYWMEGTSQATPIVSGIASLVYQSNPNLTAKQVKEILIGSAEKYVACDERTVGVVNAANAVNAAKESETEVKKEESKLGIIKGTVKNSKEELMNKNVYIYFKNTETKETNWVDTEEGNYVCVLPAGTYDIEVRIDGYLWHEKAGVKIDTDKTTTYNIVLSEKALDQETNTDNDEEANSGESSTTVDFDFSQYTSHGEFGEDGIAWVCISDYSGIRKGYINTKGEYIIPLTDKIRTCRNYEGGLVAVTYNPINTFTGQMFTNVNYGEVKIFDTQGNELAHIEQNGSTGYGSDYYTKVYSNGNMLVESAYYNSYMYVVSTKTLVALGKDSKGENNYVSWKTSGNYSEGLLYACDGSVNTAGGGFIKFVDEKGEVALKLGPESNTNYKHVTQATDFKDGKSTILFMGQNFKWYTVTIDKTGQWLDEPVESETRSIR